MDPLINLDYLCTAMIVNLQDDLFESDLSMCLAYLLNYPKVDDLTLILKLATQINKELKEPPQIKTPNDFFNNMHRLKKQNSPDVPINILCVSGGLSDDPLS